MKVFRVGLLHFQETFGKDLQFRLNSLGVLSTVNGRKVRVEVEHIKIREFHLDEDLGFDFILDRASHYFKLGITMSMIQAFQGSHLVNNPMAFHYFMERKDVGYFMAHQLGIPVPTTFILPVCETPFFKKDDFNHHMLFEWDRLIEKAGFPVFIKPANGRGARNVAQCDNKRELLDAYRRSGSELMIVQSKVKSPYPWQIRCLCIGRKILPIKYIFRSQDRSEYLPDVDFLSPELEKKIIDMSRVINRIFGYEMNSVEFFIDEKQKPWAIDFNNPIPDGRQEALTTHWYEEYLEAMIELVVGSAIRERKESFLPDLNPYAAIARENISKEERFRKALLLANQYYETSAT